MAEEIERARELHIADGSMGSWRGVAAAWLIVILFVLLFAMGEAVACRHKTSPLGSSAGAMIPRHDPRGPNEIVASDWQERIGAGGYFGL